MTGSGEAVDGEQEFLAAAVRAFQATGGPAALDSLGWWDLLAQLDAVEPRSALFALFRAQGRQLASTPALGALLAQPYLVGTAAAAGSVVAAVPRRAASRDPVWYLAGEPGDRQLLIDHPGHGAWIVDADQVEVRPLDLPGRLHLHEVHPALDRWEATLDEQQASVARLRGASLGRLALAFEILGAAEAAVELAVEYARDRRQFGQPIGTFQAVRHLLAWARTDCVALENVTRLALRLGGAAPPRFAEVAKALAGRNGRRACERALQVLGGIGFTAEHDHHHYHNRVLALDALLGASGELTRDLGRWLAGSAADPGFTAAALSSGAVP